MLLYSCSEINNNGLVSLPNGVFTGLHQLQTLSAIICHELTFKFISNFSYIYNNDITALPAGVFSGLARLVDLFENMLKDELSDTNGLQQ